MDDEDIPISNTDELDVAGGRKADHVRTLGDFKATNTPLSWAEIERRKQLARKTDGIEWTPGTAETIEEMAPIPEGDPAKPHSHQ